MRAWMKRHKILTGLLAGLAVTYAAWNYFFEADLDKEAYQKSKPRFLAYLDSQGWFEKNNNLTCHVIYAKEESDLNERECVGSIYDLSYPITKQLVALFSMNFKAFSVPGALVAHTDILDKLKDFIASDSGHENGRFLILIRREAERYGSIEGIEFFIIKEK